MEGEVKNLIKVWILATTCVCYCYYIASKIPKGILRLVSLFPVNYLFIILPLNLTTTHLCVFTAFYLTWLANFKLLLFSFDQGPLSLPPPSNLFHFFFLVCLPIKLSTNTRNDTNQHFEISRSLILAFKIALFAIACKTYSYQQFLHPYVIMFLSCLHVYLELELTLAISAILTRTLLGFELEPQFNQPYLTTSLQDFWGHRWNLMVTSILRSTVYNPIRHFSIRIIGPVWPSLPAIVVTFIVSGLMHELVYFYITRVNPTWEVTWFFILHGIFVAIEVAVKKVVKDRWRLHPLVSGPLTIVVLAFTGSWLFFPQLIRNGVREKKIQEYSSLVDFIKHKLSFFLFN